MTILAAYAVPHPPLLIPEVGRGQERKVAATTEAYKKIALEAVAGEPDCVVILTPHGTVYSDYIHISPGDQGKGSFVAFGVPGVKLQADYDTGLIDAISEQASRINLAAGPLGSKNADLDHGTLIPLYFLRQAGYDGPIVRASISGLSPIDHYRFGVCIQKAARELGRRIVVVGSGDLSHRLKDEGPYGFAPEGPVFDREIMDILGEADFSRLLTLDPELAEGAGECGLRSFQIMAGCLDGTAVTSRVLSYEGPFGVGYGIAAFQPTGSDAKRHFGQLYEIQEKERLQTLRSEESPYVRLARAALESYLRDRSRPALPDDWPEEAKGRRAGVFVTLKKDGQLRGCIGTIAPVEADVAAEIMRNAVSSGVGDPRFDPVQPEELPKLVYSVDVLGAPEAVDGPERLDPQRYGVIVTHDQQRGLLLPALEGVRSVEQQLKIALAKAGIAEDAPYKIERFEVVRHK